VVALTSEPERVTPRSQGEVVPGFTGLGRALVAVVGATALPLLVIGLTALLVGGATIGAGAWIGAVSGGSCRLKRQHEPNPLPMLEHPVAPSVAETASAAKAPFQPRNLASFMRLSPGPWMSAASRAGL
jgi:hypothetical protein